MLGRIVTFHRFVDFVTADIPDGLGTDVATIQKLLRGNQLALGELNPALPSHGGDRTSPTQQDYNVILAPTKQQGNTSDYTLRRLKRDAPEVFARVQRGEIPTRHIP